MKKRYAVYLLHALIIGLFGIGLAADGTIHPWTGKGSRSNTLEFEIREPTVGTAADFIPGTDNTNSLGTSSLRFDDIQTMDITVGDDLTVTDDAAISSTITATGDIRQGTASTAHSTTTAEGMIRWCYLGGSTAAVPGHLLVASNATLGTGEGVTVAVADNTTDNTAWIGICAVATATGSVVPVYINGFVFALTTGTVAEGNTLVNDTTYDGYLKADTTPTTGADVGVALEDGVAAGGRTLIRLR